LVKELPLIVSRLRKDIVVNIDSNLTKIKEAWSPIFKRALFSTTIDSIEDNIQSKTRGHLASTTIEGIKFLKKQGIAAQVVIVVTEHNVNSLERTAKYLLNAGVKRIGISRVRMVGRALNFGYDYFYRDLDKIKTKTAQIVKKLIDSYGKERVLVYNLWHSEDFFSLGYKYEPSCKCALFKACVDWSGFIYPCELMPFYWESFENVYKLSRPNLRKLTISQAFDSELFKFFRGKMLHYPVGCESYGYKKVCNHGCRFYAFLTSDDLLAKDITCGVNSVYDVVGCHYYSPLFNIGKKRRESGTADFIRDNSKLLGEKIYDLGCRGGSGLSF